MNSFWFHYNKPASRKAGKPQITIHYKGQCLILDNVQCNVPVCGKIRKSQPFFVMSGRAKNIEVRNGIGIIT